MKRTTFLHYVASACFLMLIISCHKRGDFEVPCKILKIAYHDPNGHPGDPSSNYEGSFTYNAWGDPTSLIWDFTTTGRTNFYFNYNKKRQLSEFIGRYEGSAGFDHYTKYFYANDGRLLYDTTWYGGPNINDPRNAAYGYTVNTYTFDSKGRVTQVNVAWNNGMNLVNTYNYDANGNKIRNDGFTYDNKKNYLRTNTVLMFILRDYSINNYKPALAYNNRGLPLNWDTQITFWNSFINEVEYNCN